MIDGGTAESGLDGNRDPGSCLSGARRRRFVIAGLAALVGLAGIVEFRRSSAAAALATSEARRGRFTVGITISGELRATNSFTVTAPRSQFPQLQLVFLVSEGKIVQAGEVVARFGTSDVDKTIADKDSDLQSLQSDFEKLRADQSGGMSELEGALAGARLAHEQAKLQVERMKFEAEVTRRNAEIELERNGIALEQAEKKIESRKIIDASERKKQLLKIEQTRGNLDKARQDKDQFAIKAPMPGLVVYETNWRTQRKIAVGDQPWPGMSIMTLPDLSKMQVLGEVNEVDVGKVRAGQQVHIRLDAFPEKQFEGLVASLGSIGKKRDQSSQIKTFEVVIDVEGSDSILKPGMTTSNEIVMESIPDALSVPLEAVFEKDGKVVVYRVKHGSSKAVQVRIGAKNGNFVVIKDGIEEGDRVALRDPEMARGSEEAPPSSAAPAQTKPRP